MSITVEKCLQAWTNSLKQMNAKADIVFFGDSLTYYGDFSSAFPGKVICNLGLKGDTLQGMIDRVEQIRILKPKVVYLMAGINDVTSYNYEHLQHSLLTLIGSLFNTSSDIDIILQSLLPVNNKDFYISCNNIQVSGFNELIKTISKDKGLRFIDLYSAYIKHGLLPITETIDGIHLYPQAYKKWINLL